MKLTLLLPTLLALGLSAFGGSTDPFQQELQFNKVFAKLSLAERAATLRKQAALTKQEAVCKARIPSGTLQLSGNYVVCVPAAPQSAPPQQPQTPAPAAPQEP